MLRKFIPFQASASFQFKDPDTGYFYKAPTLGQLYQDIDNYREQNNLEPIENLNFVVENYLCSLPENANRCCSRQMPTNVYTYIKGGIALAKNMLFKKFVTKEVAEKRAAQCITCPHNIFPDRDVFPAWSDTIAEMSVMDRKVSVQEKLGHCEVCKCLLKSKVFYDGTLDKFKEEDLVKLRGVDCWQLKLSGQDK